MKPTRPALVPIGGVTAGEADQGTIGPLLAQIVQRMPAYCMVKIQGPMPGKDMLVSPYDIGTGWRVDLDLGYHHLASGFGTTLDNALSQVLQRLPEGFEAQVRPRSGLAAKHGVTVLNSPGTIDADYRGEISVILINHGRAAFTVRRGERIAQMVIAPVVQAQLVPVTVLTSTDRGSGGFGSTGR